MVKHIAHLCLLYGMPYDLQRLLQCKIYTTFIIMNLYKKLHKIVKLIMSWLVGVSQLCINNVSNIKIGKCK